MARVALLALALLAVAAGRPAAGAGAPCQRQGWREIARDRQANVLVRRGSPGAAAACLFRRDKLLRLASPDEDYVSHVTLRGHFVAFFDHFVSGSDDFETTQFKVADIARRKLAFADRTTLWVTGLAGNDRPPPKALPVVIELKPSGSVAWSTCPWHMSGGEFGEPLRCNRPRENTRYEVLAHSAGAADRRHARILDSGPAVDLKSLRLRGSRLTWRKGERLRHATLR